MTRDGDFEFDLPFRHAVFTSIEQKNLYESMTPKKALRAGIDPPRPTFAILSDYIDEKIAGVMRKDPLDAARALRELNWVLHSLVYGIKHPEFKKTLETVEAARATIGEFCGSIL